jgi:hypothetical protein
MREHTPPSRTGPWSRLVGPLPPAESLSVLGVAVAAAAATWRRSRTQRGALASALIGGLALDLAGGLVAFQLPPTRRTYAQKQGSDRLMFVTAHVHPFVLPALGSGTWRRAGARYAAALGANVLFDRTRPPAASRRVLAASAAGVASLIDLPGSGTPERWFGPLYLLKLIGGHAGIPQWAPSDLAGSIAQLRS